MKKITYIIAFGIAILLMCGISYGMPLPLLPDSVQPLEPEEIAFYLIEKDKDTEYTASTELNKDLNLCNSNEDWFAKLDLEKQGLTLFIWNLYKKCNGVKEADLRNLPLSIEYPEIHWIIIKEKRSYPKLCKLSLHHQSLDRLSNLTQQNEYCIAVIGAPPFLDDAGTRFQIKLE